MARIRTIKPELLEDQRTASLNDAQWRLFVSLILLADDYGNLRANPIQITGAVFWGSDPTKATAALLAALETAGLITLYQHAGQPYAHLNGWSKHQRVDHPGAPHCPGPDHGNSRGSREGLANSSRGPREKDESASSVDTLEDPREGLARDSRLTPTPTEDLTPIRDLTPTPSGGPAARWKAVDWFTKFKAAWIQVYPSFSYWPTPADSRATRDLDEALADVSPTDVLAAQERAPEMFREFLAEDTRDVVRARHPWSWFVQRFNGLRFPRREAAGGDVKVGHARAGAKAATRFATGGRRF
jgi:hypothetical protein